MSFRLIVAKITEEESKSLQIISTLQTHVALCSGGYGLRRMVSPILRYVVYKDSGLPVLEK